MIANKDILYQYPASLGDASNVGKLLVSSSRLMWSNGTYSTPGFMASWDDISSVQTGKIKYCGIRVALKGSNEYVKFIIGPTNPTNLLILEELRRVVKTVRKHFEVRNSPDSAPITPDAVPTKSTLTKSYMYDPDAIVRRHRSLGGMDDDLEAKESEFPPGPAALTAPRLRSVHERVRGKTIPAKIAVFGGRKKEPDSSAGHSDTSPGPLRPSPMLTEYIQRSQSGESLSKEGVGRGVGGGNPSPSPKVVVEANPENGQDLPPVPIVPANGSESALDEGQSTVERAQRLIAEKKEKRMALMKRNESVRGAGLSDGSRVSGKASPDDASRSRKGGVGGGQSASVSKEFTPPGPPSESPAAGTAAAGTAAGTAAVGTNADPPDVKSLVAQQQNRRAALIRRRSGIV